MNTTFKIALEEPSACEKNESLNFITCTAAMPLSSFLLSLTMAQVQPRNPRKLVLPRSQPSPGNPQQWGHKLVYTCPSFPPFSEHHWEAFCILLSRRETCCLEQQPPKKALFVFASSFLILLTPSLLSDP